MTESKISSGRKKIKPIASVRDHKWITTAILSITLLSGALFFFLKGPTYQSNAVIEVLPRYVTNLDADSELQIRFYSQFVQNQVYTLTSYDTLLYAFDILESKDSDEIDKNKDKQELAKDLKKALSVEHIRHTYRIVVALAGEKPDGLAEIVNAVLDAYLEKVNDDKILDKDVRVENLNKRKAELTSELHSLVSRKSELVAKMGIIAFEGSIENPYDKALLDASNALAEARNQRIEADMSLQNTKFAFGEFNEIALDIAVEKELNENSYLNALREALSDKKIRLLSNIAGTTEGHPGRLATERQIEEIEKEFDRVKADIAKEVHKRLKRQIEQKIKFEKEKLESAVRIAHLREKSMEKEFKLQKENVSQHAMLYNAALNLRDKIDQNRKQLTAIAQRLNFFKTEENSPGFVRISSRARTPDEPLSGKKLKILIMMALIGLLLSILIPTLIDYLNPWIKTPIEIESILRFPSLGWVIEANNPSMDNFRDDQLRRLAISISQQIKLSKKKFFVITSVKPGGGTTTLTLQLNEQLRAIGIQSLAVECNAFKNDHKFVNGHPEIGLTEILKGSKTFSADDFGMPLNQLEKLSIGDTNGRRQIPFGENFLNKLAESGHDAYLLDAPPILLSSDAEYLCRACDATILVVEAEGVLTGEIKRASSVLEKIEPPLVGFIANRIRVKRNSGYFNKLLQEFDSGKKIKTPRD